MSMKINQILDRLSSDFRQYALSLVQDVQMQGGAVVPSGTIIHGLWVAAPVGFLICDGSEYNVSDYYDLYSVLVDIDATTRATWGSAGWTTTFNVPDLRGEFLRMAGANSRAGEGGGGAIGVHQESTKHVLVRADGSSSYITIQNAGDAKLTSDFNGSLGKLRAVNSASSAAGSADYPSFYKSRPTNTSVNYAIKT